MKSINLTFKKLLIFIITVLICGTVIAVLFYTEPIKESMEENEFKAKKVTVVHVVPNTYRAVINIFGETVPKWETTVRAQASGKITYISDNLQVGNRIDTNEKIIEIDKSIYISLVSEAKLRLENAILQYLKEKTEAEQAKNNWKRSGLEGEPSSLLVFHEPQLKVANAEIYAAQRALEKEQKELSYCTVKAPYLGLVIERFISKGSTVFAGDEIFKIISTDDVEIIVNISNYQILTLGKWNKVLVSIVDSSSGESWKGKILRGGSYQDSKTRLRRFYISPSNGQKKLLAGMFLSVSIAGMPVKNLLAIPESSLTRDELVWFVDDKDTLRSFKADIAFYQDNQVFIKNNNNYEELKVVVVPLQNYISGFKVNPVLQLENH